MNLKLFVGIGSLIAALTAQAQHAPVLRMAYEAIESKSGRAEYTFNMAVPWVSLMRQRVEFPGPITMRTAVLKRYSQEGCAQLQTHFQMHNARRNKGRLEDATFTISFDVCTDGNPPLDPQELIVENQPKPHSAHGDVKQPARSTPSTSDKADN